jgi:D-3-phosphoglycerate dehydrogenase
MIAGTEPLSRHALEKAGALKVISRCGIGTDNVDLGAAKALDIDVLNTPDAPTDSVAELTLALILGALRRIAEADRGIRAGVWRPLMGGLLRNRVLGIVGYGRVGRRVATLAHAFGARILAFDVREFEPGPRVERTGFDALLGASDIVTLHMPSAPLKEPVITAERLALMKRGAILVNTSRGDLVDEDALAQALSVGTLAAAALDTFANEPYSGPLAKLEQVTLTAHMGSYAEEARATMEEEAARNLLEALAARGLAPTAAAG